MTVHQACAEERGDTWTIDLPCLEKAWLSHCPSEKQGRSRKACQDLFCLHHILVVSWPCPNLLMLFLWGCSSKTRSPRFLFNPRSPLLQQKSLPLGTGLWAGAGRSTSGFGNQKDLDLNPDTAFINCVTSCKLIDLSVPCFPPLKWA